MDLVQQVTEELKGMEGFRRLPYRDTQGFETIGYGRNLTVNGIAMDEADFLLHNDILEAIGHLTALPFWEDLTQNRQAALANLMFNIGYSRFQAFQKMLSALEVKNYQIAAFELLNSIWATQVGVGRSNALADLIRKG